MSKIKRDSNAGVNNNKGKGKVPKTNAEIISNLLENANLTIAKQVSQGKIIVNPISKTIPKATLNPEQYYQNIQQSLSALRDSILQQKKAQKIDEKAKLLKAHQLIDRMKKEREQYRQKIHQQSKQNILHRRIYSDTVINKMRQKLEQRIATKRIQIQERVQAIQQRKKKRQEQMSTKQIQYKQNLKEIKQNAKSSLKLPSLHSLSQKSRASNRSLHKSSFHQLNLNDKQPAKYESSANRYLKLTSLKNESIQFNPIQLKNSNRLHQIIIGHHNLSQKLSELDNIKSNQFQPYHANRSKIMGNQFLKDSLLIIKKNASSTLQQVHDLKGSIQLQSQEAHINKNEKIERLQQKWERMLSKIKHNEISKEQGLQLLSTIERRLDKMDLQGVTNRLKKKYQILSNQPMLPLEGNKKGSGNIQPLRLT